MPINNNPVQYNNSVGRLSNKNTQQDQSAWAASKALVGSTLGQAAFNYVQGEVPRIHVDNSVNAGVRALADQVNTGAANFSGATINTAMRAFSSAAGINPDVIPADPNGRTIFDTAQTATRALGEAAIVGIIDEADLPGNISSMAALAFLQQLASSAFPGLLGGVGDGTDPGAGPQHYAQDLIDFAPKYNFMFMVKFVFHPAYESVGQDVKFHYLCRSVTRPDINIEYENINMYNFHTKVATRLDYGPVNIRLFDDNQNSSMTFLSSYLKERSEVANKSNEEIDLMELQGMSGAASIKALKDQNRAILKQVEVFHIFDYGNRVNRFTYQNPKIMSFAISELDMDNGTEPATLDIQLSFENLYIEPDYSMSPGEIQERSKLGTRYMQKYA